MLDTCSYSHIFESNGGNRYRDTLFMRVYSSLLGLEECIPNNYSIMQSTRLLSPFEMERLMMQVMMMILNYDDLRDVLHFAFRYSLTENRPRMLTISFRCGFHAVFSSY